jgi:2-dehydro-3-deoxyphosphogluconate aldolase/(4S)-4-hydroxy-2-oxoglutarate aldolase
MNNILQKAGQLGVIPVVKIENAARAVQLGKALLAGNLPVAEITFRTAAAEEAITRITGELPELLVGAGTVLKTEQVDKAVKAGAKFIVAPGFNPKVVDYCIQRGIPVTPGITSPTELEMALDRGLNVVKFFPAEACGGLSTLKAIAEPYDGVMFIPTGGINEKNLAQYLSFKRVLACGGSWMVKADMISAGRFDEITRLTVEAVAIVKSARK